MDLLAKELVYKPDTEFHLNNISFGMKKGEIYTILGRTLSGKTTLLKAIAGLVNPQSGRILFDGADLNRVPVWKRNIAMVYQQFINYPHLNVFDNVAFPLRQRGVSDKELKSRVSDAIERVGLKDFESRKIQALSGGQQQRVALARSLAKQAKILLLDEPLVNLDYKLREQLREEFGRIFTSEFSSESILVYSSTDPMEAMQLGGETIVLDEGQILQQGPASEIFENPATTRVAEITNDPAMNLLPGVIEDSIRASDISLSNKGHGFTVELAEISGSETFLHARYDDISLVGQLDLVKNFNVGDAVNLQFDAQKLYAFSADGNLVSSPFQEFGRG
ncbi:MAG: ABC transporter ATP-binding protein [Rhodobacteraceae bacterium]|nr:ABC transporter ATP-binding protein [Paracoccaceae bacterium]